MNRKTHLIAFLIASCAILASCEKEPDNTDTPQEGSFSKVAYILNEGNYGGNNAELSLLDLENGSCKTTWFTDQNKRGLGDQAQDIIRYGSHLYVSVTESNTIEVIDPTSGRSLHQIDMGHRGPRYLLGYKENIYVSCYDKTIVRIDTSSLEIEAVCPLSGLRPEEFCVYDNRLYICNVYEKVSSGTIYDSTISVVDLTTFQETRKFTVGFNPRRIRPLPDNRVVIACIGDYANISGQTIILDLNNGNRRTIPVTATDLDVYQGQIYAYSTSYDSQWNPLASFFRIDPVSGSTTPILRDYGTTLRYAYGININPANGDILVCNSPYNCNGDVYCFSSDGTLRWHTEAGPFASQAIF